VYCGIAFAIGEELVYCVTHAFSHWVVVVINEKLNIHILFICSANHTPIEATQQNRFEFYIEPATKKKHTTILHALNVRAIDYNKVNSFVAFFGKCRWL
jgi:hypothetical protein